MDQILSFCALRCSILDVDEQKHYGKDYVITMKLFTPMTVQDATFVVED